MKRNELSYGNSDQICLQDTSLKAKVSSIHWTMELKDSHAYDRKQKVIKVI